jgi:trimeric autotransporter adhesin
MLTGRKLPLTLAFMVLIGLAVGAGCRGFFVKPNLTQIAVGPATPTIQTGTTNNTQQFTAFGTFDDGSHSNPAVTWSSSDDTVATISASGLATAVSQGTTTITATSVQNPTITGSQPLKVTVGCIISIAVTPTNPSITVGNAQTFLATATTCSGTAIITDVATWVSSNTTVATINSSGVATGLAAGTTNITAAAGGVTSPIQVLTVNVTP